MTAGEGSFRDIARYSLSIPLVPAFILPASTLDCPLPCRRQGSLDDPNVDIDRLYHFSNSDNQQSNLTPSLPQLAVRVQWGLIVLSGRSFYAERAELWL